MPTQPYFYAKQEEKTTYLSGVVEGLTKELLRSINVPDLALAADVFYIGENNEIAIVDAVRNRLSHYCDMSGIVTSPVHEKMLIKEADFTLEQSTYPSLSSAILALLNENTEKIQKSIYTFTDDLITYLGNPRQLYRMHEMENRYQIFHDFYMRLVDAVLFVEYQNYVVMIVFGTNE
ncbi:MAG: hypothetical protein ACI4DO_07055 [Roseburia sp.]